MTAVDAASPHHRRQGVLLGALVVVMLIAGSAWAQEVRYLRVGTGPPGENHFPLGGLIASAISNPPGAQPCQRGGSCGVDNLIAVALATSGSVSNIEAIDAGRLDAAVVQSDVALWASEGRPPFERRAVDSVRSVADLYADQVHLVVRTGLGVRSPRDLKGKRVSLGEVGSGTLAHALQVLAAWGLKERDVKAQYLRSALAADAVQADKLDAFFVVDGAPVPSVAELAKSRPIRLVPIDGVGADRLRSANRLLTVSRIAAGTYQGVNEEIATLEVAVKLVVAARLPEDLVRDLTAALWHPATARLLSVSQPPGAQVRPCDTVRAGDPPLHPGASRYYFEHGPVEPAR
jgi:hypothetical protein